MCNLLNHDLFEEPPNLHVEPTSVFPQYEIDDFKDNSPTFGASKMQFIPKKKGRKTQFLNAPFFSLGTCANRVLLSGKNNNHGETCLMIYKKKNHINFSRCQRSPGAKSAIENFREDRRTLKLTAISPLKNVGKGTTLSTFFLKWSFFR